MTDGEEDITSLECKYFDDSKVKKIHEEFSKICDVNSGSQKCLAETQDDREYCSIVANNLKDLNIIKDVKKQTDVYKRVKKCNSDIKDKTNDVSANICIFRNLNITEIERMKKIFDFYLFYYKKIKDFTVEEKSEKYQKHFKEGFYEHCNGIIDCLNERSNSEYCDEFKEYHYYNNAFRVFLESLILYGKEADGSDCNNGCVLAESLLKGQYLIELKGEIKRIKSKYSSTNYSNTVITVIFSVIGTVMGVFLISYYFFGITPREFWVRIRKLKNKEAHINVDDETEDKSLFISENQENGSKNKGYSISYKSVKYS
ncbi:PIR Superfamily Protein [Plasmodium ovale wallikeri]|uniref:PIR Superfamily Protein n=1 Tax=Plasmodium ovale wallikeri TaxID=864142 RepID=A0A1A9AQV1_PLAOA|nr:PIR Superfamily Protein [Plasmodium ovale wallikeri]SBT58615.1 PIR Superfamily Protein [Plasmodium ovale wallikeri]